MINNVSLTGRIATDLELKHTQSGVAVLSFRIAVDRKYKNASGERETDFINCVAWRTTAETMSQYLGKGSLIGVEGNIQTRDYENAQGQKVYVTEVVINDFAFLETKAQNQQNMQQNQSQGYNNNQGMNQNQNYNQNQNQNQGFNANSNPFANDASNPFENNVDVSDISDDDLPF